MTMYETVLYEFWKTAEFDYSDLNQKKWQMDVFESIKWYIVTDRAPLAWVKALSKADPKKLIRYVLRQENQSTDGQIKAVTDYLQRYCKLG